MGPCSPESLASTPASDLISLYDLEQDSEISGEASPGLWNGQGELNEGIGAMAFHTVLGREKGLKTR